MFNKIDSGLKSLIGRFVLFLLYGISRRTKVVFAAIMAVLLGINTTTDIGLRDVPLINSFYSTTSPKPKTFMGSQWWLLPTAADRSNDPVVGKTNAEVGVTFLADTTCNLNKVATVWGDATTQPGDYAAGNGGTMRLRLYAADASGFPTGPVLATTNVAMGLSGGIIPSYPSSGWQMNKVPNFNLTPTTLTAGNYYVVTFDNIDPNQNINYRTLHWHDFSDETSGPTAYTFSPYGGTYTAIGDGWTNNKNLGVIRKEPTRNGGNWYPSYNGNGTSYLGTNLLPGISFFCDNGYSWGSSAWATYASHGWYNNQTTGGDAALFGGCQFAECRVSPGFNPYQRVTADANFSVDKVRIGLVPYQAGNIIIRIENDSTGLQVGGDCTFAIPTLDQSNSHPGYVNIRSRTYSCLFPSPVALTNGTTYRVRVYSDGTSKASILAIYDTSVFGWSSGPMIPGGASTPGNYVAGSGVSYSYADLQIGLRVYDSGIAPESTTTTTASSFPNDGSTNAISSCVGGTRFEAESLTNTNAAVPVGGSPVSHRVWTAASTPSELRWTVPGSGTQNWTYTFRYQSSTSSNRWLRGPTAGGATFPYIVLPSTGSTWGTFSTTLSVLGGGTEYIATTSSTSGAILLDYVEMCPETPPTTTTTVVPTTTIPAPAGTNGGSPVCAGGIRLDETNFSTTSLIAPGVSSFATRWSGAPLSYAEWVQTAAYTTTYDFTIRYWVPSGTSTRFFVQSSPSVNNQISFTSTGGSWGTQTWSASVVAGSNTWRISWPDNAARGEMAFDYIDACPNIPASTTTTTTTVPTNFPNNGDRGVSADCVGGWRFQAESGLTNSMTQGGGAIALAGSPASSRYWTSPTVDAQLNWMLPGSGTVTYVYRVRYQSLVDATRLFRAGATWTMRTFPATGVNTWGTVDHAFTLTAGVSEGLYSVSSTSGDMYIDYVDVCPWPYTPVPTTTTTTTTIVATTTTTTTTTSTTTTTTTTPPPPLTTTTAIVPTTRKTQTCGGRTGVKCRPR